MVATAIYSVTMVLWKETAFPFAEPWKGVIIVIINHSAYVVCAIQTRAGNGDGATQER